MKALLYSLLVLCSCVLRAAEDPVIATLRAADDERVAATRAGDRKRLEAIYAGDLHYSHSNGKIDDQASYIESLVKKTTVYEKYDYVRREFRLMGPGVAVMIGRVLVQSTSNGTRQNNDLNFLGVWRLDQGKWQFAAWQSCKNLPPEAKK